jgi:hypothetical protein
VLIACRDPSTLHWKIILECSLCHSHNSRNVWHCVCVSNIVEAEDVMSEALRVLTLQVACCCMLRYEFLFQLYLFTQNRYVDRRSVSGLIRLPSDEIKEILEQISTLRVKKGWELRLPFDKEFVSR